MSRQCRSGPRRRRVVRSAAQSLLRQARALFREPGVLGRGAGRASGDPRCHCRPQSGSRTRGDARASGAFAGALCTEFRDGDCADVAYFQRERLRRSRQEQMTTTEEMHVLKKLTIVLAASAAALVATTTAGMAQTKLKWAHVYETSEPFHTASVWAAQEINKRTNNRYAIDVYPASQLGKEADINQGLSLGSVDIIISGSSFAAKTYPPIGVTYYPYTFRDADHLLAYTKTDVFRELTKGYADKTGHQIVAVTYYGVRQTSSNRAIKVCADMKGLKMRVPDVPAYLAMPRACGANTAPIAFAEVYLALQNGTVEAQENPLTTIEAKKFYEVQKHIVLTGHIVDHLNTVVAGALWKKLSDEDKKIFTDVAQEAAAKATDEIKQNEAKLVAFFKEKGLTVTEVDKNEFRDIVLKNVPFETFGYRKADWERIQAVK